MTAVEWDIVLHLAIRRAASIVYPNGRPFRNGEEDAIKRAYSWEVYGRPAFYDVRPSEELVERTGREIADAYREATLTDADVILLQMDPAPGVH